MDVPLLELSLSPKRQLAGRSIADRCGSTVDRLPLWLAWLLLVSGPFLACLALSHAHFGLDPWRAIPFHADDYRNWLTVASYVKAGMSGGYFTHNEIPAAWSLTRFSADGPWYPVLFGSVARGLGWGVESGVWMNLAVVTVCLAAYVVIARPDRRESTLLATFLITFHPIQTYFLSTSYNVSQYGLGMMLGAVFLGLFSSLIKGKDVSRWRGAVLLVIAICSVYKINWVVFYLPALLAGNLRPLRKLAAMLAAFAVLCALHAWILTTVGAPVLAKESTLKILGGDSGDLQGVATYLWGLWGHNLQSYFSGQITSSEWYVLTQALLLFSAGALAGVFRGTVHSMAKAAMIMFVGCGLGGVFILINALYVPYSFVGMRYLSWHMTAVLLGTIRWLPSWLTVLLILFNLAALIPFQRAYRAMHLSAFSSLNRAAIFEFSRKAQEYMPFAPEATGWQKTVLHATGDYPPEILGLPPGYGYSVLMDRNAVAFPLKSGYIILDGSRESLEVARLSRLKPLFSFNGGTVYINLDAWPSSSAQTP